jgi:hypothetical protein
MVEVRRIAGDRRRPTAGRVATFTYVAKIREPDALPTTWQADLEQAVERAHAHNLKLRDGFVISFDLDGDDANDALAAGEAIASCLGNVEHGATLVWISTPDRPT